MRVHKDYARCLQKTDFDELSRHSFSNWIFYSLKIILVVIFIELTYNNVWSEDEVKEIVTAMVKHEPLKTPSGGKKIVQKAKSQFLQSL